MAAHGGSTDSQESLDISRHGNDSPPSSLPTLDKEFALSSFVGKIISAGAAFSDIFRIMTRYCFVSVASSSDWDSRFHPD